jgi:hypothetical protein
MSVADPAAVSINPAMTPYDSNPDADWTDMCAHAADADTNADRADVRADDRMTHRASGVIDAYRADNRIGFPWNEGGSGSKEAQRQYYAFHAKLHGLTLLPRWRLEHYEDEASNQPFEPLCPRLALPRPHDDPLCFKRLSAAQAKEVIMVKDAGERLEAIKRRANALWLQDGKIDGRDKAHWEEAERQIDLEAETASKNVFDDQNVTATFLQEAYEAGKASIAAELKSRVAIFLERMENADFGSKR